MQLNTVVTRVTPAIAKIWLKKNTANRPPTKSAVNHYAREMSLGRWRLTGDSIKFDVKGRLIDGQNRLMACIQSGCSFETLVVRGIESKAFNVLDQGVMRNAAHAFARDGKKNYVQLAAAVRLIWLVSRNKKVQYGKKLSIDDSYKILKQYPLLESACEMSTSWYHKNKTSPFSLSVVSGFMSLCCDGSGGSLARAVNFWKPAVTGEGLESNSPQSKLRTKLLSAKLKGQPLGRDMVNALVIKAWNAYAHGEELQVLRFDPAVEKMPVLRP